MSLTLSNALPTGTISALIGQPPATEDDYYIVQFILFSFGLKTNPMFGAKVPPARPANYVFETKGPNIIASCSVSLAVMIIVTGLRLGVRLFGQRLKWGWDDWVIILGVFFAICWPALQIATVTYAGAGKHIYDNTYVEYNNYRGLGNTARLIFYLSISIIKVSICLFNKRLTYLASRSWAIFNNIFLAILLAYIIAALSLNIFQCDPAYSGWNAIRLVKEVGRPATCVSPTVLGPALSAVHIITDFGLLSVPIIVLWKVNMDWATRLRLYLMFSVGSVSCIGSIMRQVVQSQIASDIPWNVKQIIDWTLVDLTFGVVAASLPILSAFLPKSWNTITSSPGHSKEGRHQNSSSSSSGNHLHNGRSAVMHSGRRNSLTGMRHGRSDSEENIIRTDEVELSYQQKGDLEASSTKSSDSRGLSRRSDLEFGQDGIMSKSAHKTWIGVAE